MTQMTITEFLTARLDERESGVREALRTEDYGVSQWDLDDIAAKRGILHQHGTNNGGHECPDGFMDSAETEPHIGYEVNCMTQKFLALPYAAHPDYDSAWALPAST